MGVLGSAALQYWEEDAVALNAAVVERGREQDSACFITAYTQEWYAYDFAEETPSALQAQQCASGCCASVSAANTATKPALFARGLGAHTCGVCRAACYCSALCLELDWKRHKWPQVGAAKTHADSIDCNRSPYRVLNQRLLQRALGKRAGTTGSDCLMSFTKMLLLALGALDPVACTVYRALSRLPRPLWERFAQYAPGESFVLNNFNSTSTACGAAEAFLGDDVSANLRVFFRLDCIQGFSIGGFSRFPGEQEVLLGPGSVFRVVRRTVSCDGSRLDLHAMQLPPHEKVSRAFGGGGADDGGCDGRGSAVWSSIAEYNGNGNGSGDSSATQRHVVYLLSHPQQHPPRGSQVPPQRCSVAIVLQGGQLLQQRMPSSGNQAAVPVCVVPHGGRYQIQVKSGFDVRASVSVSVDGHPIGAWVLQARECFTIERPAAVASCFTFLQVSHAVAAGDKATVLSPAGTGIEADRDVNGLVECCFTPEDCSYLSNPNPSEDD
jgi:hypothetical protein